MIYSKRTCQCQTSRVCRTLGAISKRIPHSLDPSEKMVKYKSPTTSSPIHEFNIMACFCFFLEHGSTLENEHDDVKIKGFDK